MTGKELITDQYRACYDEENWFVPLMKSLKGLTEDQAKWYSGASDHSIMQIVNHLTYWNERYLFRFRMQPIPEKLNENSMTFENADIDWDSAVKKLDAVMSALLDEIRKADEQKLNSSPFKDGSSSWYEIIANINIHNAYHVGQIVFLRKLQGSWDPEQGVK